MERYRNELRLYRRFLCGFRIPLTILGPTYAVAVVDSPWPFLCLLPPSLPVFCGASDLELRLFDDPAVGASRSLNRKQIKAQASRIANLLRKTDVSYLIGHYTIPKEMNEVCNWLTARLGLEG
ncbi:hypothetical protein V6Z11_A04G086300 [Gossypium hirsutum]